MNSVKSLMDRFFKHQPIYGVHNLYVKNRSTPKTIKEWGQAICSQIVYIASLKSWAWCDKRVVS
jgi:hypothetical protein